MSEFVAHVLELMRPLGAVRAKRMFGGHGIFLDDLMFALVVDDDLFLKADDETRAKFERAGLGRFVYEKKGKPVSLSYYSAPGEALEDSQVLSAWAREAHAAALRAAGAKRRRAARGGGT